MKWLILCLLIAPTANARPCTKIILTTLGGKTVEVPYDLIKSVTEGGGEVIINSDHGHAHVKENTEVIYKKINECKHPAPKSLGNVSSEPPPLTK